MTRSEAQPLGIAVPDAAVTRATNRRMIEWERRVRAAAKAAGGQEIEPALWLQRVAGVGLDEFRGWVRAHTEVELMQDRLLRLEQLQSLRVEVSILVVADRGEADRLVARARADSDFAGLARTHSVHASRPEGGRLPYVLLPGDINDAAVREALFAARAGDVVGPLPVEAAGQSLFQIYRVERSGAPREGSWTELGGNVEEGLRTRPVHVGEYERWRRRALLRHGFSAAAPATKNPTTR